MLSPEEIEKKEAEAKAEGYVDKTLTCVDCGKTFVWTAGEQKFFKDNIPNPTEPKRCHACQKINKERLKKIRADRAAAEKAATPVGPATASVDVADPAKVA